MLALGDELGQALLRFPLGALEGVPFLFPPAVLARLEDDAPPIRTALYDMSAHDSSPLLIKLSRLIAAANRHAKIAPRLLHRVSVPLPIVERFRRETFAMNF